MTTIAPSSVLPPPSTSMAAMGEVVAHVSPVAGTAAQVLASGAELTAVVTARVGPGLVMAELAMGGETATVSIQLPSGTISPAIREGVSISLQRLDEGGSAQFKIQAVVPTAEGQGIKVTDSTSSGMVSPSSSPSSGGQALGNASGGVATLIGMSADPGRPIGLTATVLRSADLAATSDLPKTAAPVLSTALPAGSQLTVRIVDVMPVAGSLPQTPVGISAGGMALGASPVANGSGTQPSSSPLTSAPLPLSSVASWDGADMTDPLAEGVDVPQLAGRVLSFPPGGQAVVATSAGVLTMPTPSSVVEGDVLTLDVMSPPRAPMPTGPESNLAASVGFSPPLPGSPVGGAVLGLPAMALAIEVLSRGDPAVMKELTQVLPQVGPHLAAGLSRFGKAVRHGMSRGGHGAALARTLEKAGRPDLVDGLMDELQGLDDAAGRSVAGGEWRCLTLPLVYQGAIDPVRLYLRHPIDADGSKAGQGGGERFLLDFSLSQLGRLQLDGLVQRHDKHFDLIIRTDKPLPVEARRDIMAIFHEAAELVGTLGGVSFQAGGRWLELPADPPPSTIGLMA